MEEDDVDDSGEDRAADRADVVLVVGSSRASFAWSHSTVALLLADCCDSVVFAGLGREKNRLRSMWVRDFGAS